MKRIKKISKLLALSVLLVSCTEEVSEELKNKQTNNPLGSGSGSGSTVSDSSIRLVHKMDDSMSFYLHKAGTTSTPCELKPPTSDGFDAATYYKDPALSPEPQVVDCILEAQEMDLYEQGAKFELQVDAQLCEYVTYTPFRYVEAQYGNTAKTVYSISCTNSDSECNTGGFCDKLYDNYDASGIASGASLSNQLTPDQMKCQFDYSDKSGNDKKYGKNCDEGKIVYVNYRIDNTKVPISGDWDGDPMTADTIEYFCPNVANTYPLELVSTNETECGGDHLNCMGGPSVDQFSDPAFASEVHTNTDLSEFVKEWSVQAPRDRMDLESGNNLYKNLYVANYSRMCSNTGFTKTEDGSDYSLYNVLDFKGHHSEAVPWDTVTGTHIDPSTVNDAGGEVDYYTYAENPWRAVHYTLPYYSFKCLDQAHDVKAQIRLFIRDWDRSYVAPVATFANVSDIGTVQPFMDSNTVHDGDLWNDIMDWDDFFGDGHIWANNQCTTSANPFDTRKLYIDSLADPDPVFPGKL